MMAFKVNEARIAAFKFVLESIVPVFTKQLDQNGNGFVVGNKVNLFHLLSLTFSHLGNMA